jgi:hypothetical protein
VRECGERVAGAGVDRPGVEGIGAGGRFARAHWQCAGTFGRYRSCDDQGWRSRRQRAWAGVSGCGSRIGPQSGCGGVVPSSMVPTSPHQRDPQAEHRHSADLIRLVPGPDGIGCAGPNHSSPVRTFFPPHRSQVPIRPSAWVWSSSAIAVSAIPSRASRLPLILAGALWSPFRRRLVLIR